MVGVTVAISAGLALFGRPVLGLIFGRGEFSADRVAHLWWLLLLLSGVWVGGAVGQILSTSFYAQGDTRTPTRVGIVGFTLAIALKLVAFRGYGIEGLALAASAYYVHERGRAADAAAPPDASLRRRRAADRRAGQPVSAPVALERVGCPLGCASDDELVITGRDRLHDLPGEFRVVRCRVCGLMRTDPRPTLDGIDFYYPSDYRPYLTSRVSSAAPARAPKGGRVRALVRRMLRPVALELPPLPPGRLLEIGCGSGSFLHGMAQQGWTVEGIERSPDAGGTARALGYQVHIGPLETSPGSRGAVRPGRGMDGARASARADRDAGKGGPVEPRAGRGSWPRCRMRARRSSAGSATRGTRCTCRAISSTTRRAPWAKVLERAGWRLERVFWHDNPNNLLLSLRYLLLERGWARSADLLRAMADGEAVSLDATLPRQAARPAARQREDDHLGETDLARRAPAGRAPERPPRPFLIGWRPTSADAPDRECADPLPESPGRASPARVSRRTVPPLAGAAPMPRSSSPKSTTRPRRPKPSDSAPPAPGSCSISATTTSMMK